MRSLSGLSAADYPGSAERPAAGSSNSGAGRVIL